MIAANVAAARFLERRKVEGLYRVHDRPAAEKIADLRTFLGELGLTLGGGDKPEAKDFHALLEAVKGREDQHLIQTVVLRTMKQAVYSPDNIGHFGLALANYAHFTSPIRRYPDLLVHRAIRHVLRTGGPEHFPYAHDELGLIGEHCSNNERRADEATRDATDWLKCEFMQDRVGEVFEGVISAVTSFGLFVELKGVFVEGLLHITALDKDYYHFDPVGHRLVGERSGQVYRLGDAITVQVARVDLDERKIDFVLPRGEAKPAAAESAEQAPGKKKRRRRKKTGKGGGEAAADTTAPLFADEDIDEHESGDVNGNVLIEETESQPKPKKRRRRPPRRAKPE